MTAPLHTYRCSKLTHSVSALLAASMVVLPTIMSLSVQHFRLLCLQLSTLHLMEGFMDCIFSPLVHVFFILVPVYIIY